MSKDITAILKEATKDLLSPEILQEIQTVFTEAVETKVASELDAKVKEKLSLHVEKALNEQDADYSKKLETVLEALDADHAAKLSRIVDAIDSNHTNKLQKVVALYERALRREAASFKNSIVNQVDAYLGHYLDEKIPVATIREAVANTHATRVLNDLKKMLAVDTALATESIREAILDGNTIISDQRAAIQEWENKFATLNEEHKKVSANLLIEQKIADLPVEKKAHVKKMLGNKTPEYIKENYDYVLKMLDTTEEQQLEILREQATNTTHSIEASKPNEPTIEKVVAEGTELQSAFFPTYLTELSKH